MNGPCLADFMLAYSSLLHRRAGLYDVLTEEASEAVMDNGDSLPAREQLVCEEWEEPSLDDLWEDRR
jgi:hypothetical protein